MVKEQYVLEAEETIQFPYSDGYYTGKSYIYQGQKYAIVNPDIAEAKVYSSEKRATKAKQMEFANYLFRVVKLNS